MRSVPLIVALALVSPAELRSASLGGSPGVGRPTTLREIIERAEQWVIALRVERSKDLPAPPQPHLRGFPREMQSYYQRPDGWVSGVLLDEAGFVITSHYNVAGEVKSIEVMLPSGQKLPARIHAKSPADDIALLKIDGAPSDLPLRLGQPTSADARLGLPAPAEASFDPPQWADASGLRAGKFVFALGRSPDPARITVTRGIISAVGRNGGRAVQTDAELNYGNVGGPLIDLDGNIVAIAGFVGHNQPQWGVNSGIGFGTTGSAILEMLPKLKLGEDVVPFRFPMLGVRSSVRSLDPSGAKIERVLEGSPAAAVGIQDGDVIVEVDGKSVESFDQMRRLVFKKKVGEKVKVKVRRGDSTLEFEPTLGEMPNP